MEGREREVDDEREEEEEEEVEAESVGCSRAETRAQNGWWQNACWMRTSCEGGHMLQQWLCLTVQVVVAALSREQRSSSHSSRTQSHGHRVTSPLMRLATPSCSGDREVGRERVRREGERESEGEGLVLAGVRGCSMRRQHG